MLKEGKVYRVKSKSYFLRKQNTNEDRMLIKSKWTKDKFPGFAEEMLKYCGQAIMHYRIIEGGKNLKSAELDGGSWVWHESFLTEIEDLDIE